LPGQIVLDRSPWYHCSSNSVSIGSADPISLSNPALRTPCAKIMVHSSRKVQ
jgi:hypothetical protein